MRVYGAHTGSPGSDFVDFVMGLADRGVKGRFKRMTVKDLEKEGIEVQGDVPDPDMDALVFYIEGR